MRHENRTIFIADDGTEFGDLNSCLKYEAESMAVNAIFKGIPEWPSKHGSFITVSRTLLLTARRALWALVLEKYGEQCPKWKEWDADEVHPRSIVGRMLDDCGRGPIEKAWSKMSAWDFEKGRIYDQPYFVEHCGEAVPA